MEAVIGVRHTVARVHLDALAGNLRAITGMLEAESRLLGRPAPAVIGVVKANAYGHGAARIARALETLGVAMLACADIEEGVHLRESGVAAPILVFGALGVSELAAVFTHRLTPTVSSPSAAIALERAAAERRVRLACHLKVDTGMNRLGFRHDNLRRTLPTLGISPHLAIEAVYTHFATADLVEHPMFDLQRARFDDARTTLRAIGITPPRTHAANSAALLRDARVWHDLVRPGLLLYGIVPPPLATTLALQPVLSLHSRIVAVKGVRPGEGVSYGVRDAADAPRTVAVIPAGYADGLDTRLAGRGGVLVRGRRAPIIGAVCMDMLVVDVTGIDATPGDEVVLLGEQDGQRIDVREVAAAIGAIPWELLCRIGSRIERVYD